MTTIYTIEQRILAGSQFTGTNGGSTGTITTVAAASILQGEGFKLRSRSKTVFDFVFDKTTDLKDTATVRIVRLVGGMNASEVRDAIISAINRTPGLAMVASDGGASTVDLLNLFGGGAGNLPALPDTVVNAGFVVSAMSGGLNLPGDIVEVDGVRCLPPATFGGIFDFDFIRKAGVDGVSYERPALWRVQRILLQTTTATDYTVNVLSPDGTAFEVATDSGAVVMLGDPILLAGDERLQIITTGATDAMFARVTARQEG
jgi:hypothetical protein